MNRVRASWFGAALWGASLASDAHACGGCFNPPTAVDSVVTGHRMAFAMSGDRTVLWDQIKYTGNPSEFGWVLPVAPGAVPEESTDAWFEALDAVTTTRVTANPSQLACASTARAGCSCGSSAAGSSAAGAFAGNDVQVLHQGTVGPFETVTLRSTDAGSLRAWLDGHGYVVPDDITPVIDAYVGEGADFIALRLQPGQGISAMKPIRVVTPKGKPILPLRMVAAGTGATVDIVLYVIGEQRFGLKDLTEVTIDPSSLTFDLTKNESNYLELRRAALEDHGGASYLTTFAARHPFTHTFTDPNGVPVFFGPSSQTTLSDLYFTQANANDGRFTTDPSCAPAVRAGLDGDGLVVEARASELECDGHTDISTALTGMHPSQVWLTRFDMTLPREALTMDCNVGAAASQDEVSSLLLAKRLKSRPPGCPEPIFESRVAREPTSPVSTATSCLAVVLAAGLLRRSRRKRS
jgi:hypothetical protein